MDSKEKQVNSENRQATPEKYMYVLSIANT